MGAVLPAYERIDLMWWRHLFNSTDSIRQTTNLSHELSCVALKVVLSELETIYSTPVLEFIEPIAKHFTDEQLSAPDEFIEHTHDSHRLKLIFGQLAECKNDSEQRTWMLHEDEDYIVQFLTELIEILVSIERARLKKRAIYHLTFRKMPTKKCVASSCRATSTRAFTI